MAILSDYTEGENESQAKKPVEEEEIKENENQESNTSSLEPKKEEENKKLKPNQFNGLDMENYTWGQTLQDVTINVMVPRGTKSRFLDVDIKNNSIKVGLKNQPPIVEGVCNLISLFIFRQGIQDLIFIKILNNILHPSTL